MRRGRGGEEERVGRGGGEGKGGGREEERAGERRKEGGCYDNNLCGEHCEFLLRE